MPQTVFEAFVATAKRKESADFLYVESVTSKVYGIPRGAITWGEALKKVEALRSAYETAGYGYGHRVGLLLENRPDFFFHWFALNAVGASVVPINADMRSAELEYLISHSEMCLAVSLADRTKDIANAALACGCTIAVMAPAEPVPPAVTTCADVKEMKKIDAECALIYTSGTTGRPKGCILTNEYFLYSGDWYSKLNGICSVRQDQERIMTPLPLTHMNAMACSTMAVLMSGGCLIQLDRFHPKNWLESAKESGATIVHYLGVMPAMLLSIEPSTEDLKHNIRWGFGAGVGAKEHAIFEERFGFPLVEAWAMTETGASACVIANQAPRLVGSNSFGRAEPNVEYLLVDEAGQSVAKGMPGELYVRAAGENPRYGFFKGYLKNKEATDEAWEGGWFHTGDLVREDDKGNLFFVDRKKNIIRRSGENISAVEVESVINKHPSVHSAGVTAVPDAIRGDEVLACIVANEFLDLEQQNLLAKEIVEKALDELAYYKAPGYVAIVSELPLTPSQKIQRGELRSIAKSLLGEMNCFDMRSMKKRRA